MAARRAASMQAASRSMFRKASHATRLWLETAVAVLMLAGPTSLIAEAASPPKVTSGNCFQELARGRGTDLVCQYPAWLSDKERDDLRRLTRELLQDARCTVSITIARSQVMQALTQPDHTFEAPPQPVVCELTTSDQPIPISATFAPRVVIKDGVAVDATPGMANVTGVNSYLAWPVVEYVNRSATVKGEMLKMINAYLSLKVARR
jgi:hypothetical protein